MKRENIAFEDLDQKQINLYQEAYNTQLELLQHNDKVMANNISRLKANGFVETESYDLIETLAKQISEQIVFKSAKNVSMLQEIKVTVHKPNTILKDRTEGISVSYCEKFK